MAQGSGGRVVVAGLPVVACLPQKVTALSAHSPPSSEGRPHTHPAVSKHPLETSTHSVPVHDHVQEPPHCGGGGGVVAGATKHGLSYVLQSEPSSGGGAGHGQSARQFADTTRQPKSGSLYQLQPPVQPSTGGPVVVVLQSHEVVVPGPLVVPPSHPGSTLRVEQFV